jgi:DNA repair protein RadC
MAPRSLSLDSSLLVRDVAGHHRAACADEVLQAAQRLLGAQLRGREVLTSPQAVRDFLCVKLGGLEHEVFAVLMLDAQNRLIDYGELFRGTLRQAAVYLRELVKEALACNAACLILAHSVARHKMRLMCPGSLCEVPRRRQRLQRSQQHCRPHKQA